MIEPLFAVIPSAIDAETCDFIVSQSSQFEKQPAKVVGETNDDIRKSQISWIPFKHWLNGLTRHYCWEVNQEYWNFRMDGAEQIQYTEYSDDGHYDWHTDIVSWGDNMRKLSMTIQLSDPDSYEGGDFEVQLEEDQSALPDGGRDQGSIIIFPSFIVHRVTPVTKGTRRSLVNWFGGPQFS